MKIKLMVKTTLFFAILLHSITQMTHKKGGIARSLKNKETARRLRDEMIFWETIAQFHREAILASIGSYILDMFADDLWSL